MAANECGCITSQAVPVLAGAASPHTTLAVGAHLEHPVMCEPAGTANQRARDPTRLRDAARVCGSARAAARAHPSPCGLHANRTLIARRTAPVEPRKRRARRRRGGGRRPNVLRPHASAQRTGWRARAAGRRRRRLPPSLRRPRADFSYSIRSTFDPGQKKHMARLGASTWAARTPWDPPNQFRPRRCKPGPKPPSQTVR